MAQEEAIRITDLASPRIPAALRREAREYPEFFGVPDE
jgi:hypothetical protein